MIRLLRGVALAVAITPLTFVLAPAAPPAELADGRLAPWFQSLRQPGSGSSCCDLSDCRPVGTRVGPEGYEVLLTPAAFPIAEERWVGVPPHTILQGKDNPIGRAVVCWTPARGVLCFVRPTET